MGKVVLLIALAAVALFVILIFLPLPWIGQGYYNVVVSSNISETCIIACSYSVQSVNPTVTGPSTVIDLAGIFPGFSVAAPCLSCQYKVTSTLSNGQSASGAESKFVSNLFNVNYVDTVNLQLLYVPSGQYSVATVVTLNGATIATGSGSLVVP